MRVNDQLCTTVTKEVLNHKQDEKLELAQTKYYIKIY